MGSPLAPLMESIFLQNIEKKFINYKGNMPLYYTRYVDDTFLVCRNIEDVSEFLVFLNNQHPNIVYSCDFEQNKKLSFLDVQVERIDSNFNTEVYRKAKDTGLYSNPNSFSDPKYNRSMIKGLIHRIWCLNLNFKTLDTNFR